jgi:large subunit ribosomal protein L35
MSFRCYNPHGNQNVEPTVPKLKTRKSVAKRFKITGTGKVMRAKAWGNKKRLAKSARVKRTYDKFFEVPSAIAKSIRTMAPYGI